MPYTFGAATSDYVSPAATGIPTLAANTQTLIAGWFYPTTLTATRRLWTASQCAFQVDTTTSNLRFVGSNATTQGQWTASGTAITTNTWWFIAFFASFSGSSAGIRVWQGTAESSPAEMTVTQVTAPSGGWTTAQTIFIGNTNAASTVSFQGDIGAMTVIYQNTTAEQGPLPVAVGGTTTQAEADAIYRRWVLPLWQGRPDMLGLDSPSSFTVNVYHLPMVSDTWYRRYSNAASTASANWNASSGVTVSSNREPSTCSPYWCHLPNLTGQ